MAIALPARPSLDWLRKTAKQQLQALRASRPDAQLADAQLAVAREYGFLSWRALKTHIDALAESSANAEFSDDVSVGHFLRAVRAGEIDAVAAALGTAPSLVNCLGPHPHWGGRVQPLHMAIEGGNLEVFALLIAAGADVDGNNEFYEYWSPLMLTAHNRRWEMRNELLNRGATIGLAEALVFGDDRRLEAILQQGKAALAARPPGGGSWLSHARTPLAVARLLGLGADPHKPDVFQTTPIEAFSQLGERGRPLVELLARSGVKARPKEYARLGDRESLEKLCSADPASLRDDAVLTSAIDSSNVELVDWLLRHGANPNARTSHGSRGTALHCSAWQGDLRMTQLLVDAGADVKARDLEHDNTPAGFARVSLIVTGNPHCRAVAEYLENLSGETPA
jgi:ankyrin repeat protein